MGKFYQCIQSYGPSFMTKFCFALYLENLLTNIFAKLNLRGGVSCMPAALLFYIYFLSEKKKKKNIKRNRKFSGNFHSCLNYLSMSIMFL